MVNFKEIYHFSRFQRGSNIFQGGSNSFQGGSNCSFPIETHVTCDFPGGVRPLCPPPLWIRTCRGSGPPSPEKSQKYLVSEQYWSGSPVKSQNYLASHNQPASETQSKWRFAGGPMMARLLSYLDPLSSRQLQKRSQTWTPSEKTSGSAHASLHD